MTAAHPQYSEAITDVVFTTDPTAVTCLVRKVLTLVPDPQTDFVRLLADLGQSYLLCVEVPVDDDGKRCLVQFSYAASLHKPQRAGSRPRRIWHGARAGAARLGRISTARFDVAIGGLDEASSTHVQLRVPPGLRAAQLTPVASETVVQFAPAPGDRGEFKLDRISCTSDRWDMTKGLATGGVGFWQPPRAETEGERRALPTQGRLIVDLALESRGIFTAIAGTSLVLTTAIALLLWFYPSMFGDKEAQDVLVTGILIAPALVTSFVVASREPGVVSGVAQLPRLLLFVNLLLLLSCAVRTIAHRGSEPDVWDYSTLAGSSLVTSWLWFTWVLARRSERTQANSADDRLKAVSPNKSRSRAPVGDFVVPSRHGPRHSVSAELGPVTGRSRFSLDEAAQLARIRHSGQSDKQGRDYYRHHLVPITKLLDPLGEDAAIAGMLHDIVEDTDTSLDELRNLGVPEPIIRAVDSVTKREGEVYDDLISRACADPLGVHVKLADNTQNLLDIPELAVTDLELAQRLQRKYVRARDLLIAAGGSLTPLDN